MEHYVLFIWNGIAVKEDQAHIAKYFDTIFPTSLQYQYALKFANQVAFLLKPVSKYVALLNKLQESDNAEWTGPSEDLNVKDIFSEGLTSDNFDSEPASKDFIQSISASLHTLADQLPTFGTYKLDVLLGSDVINNISVSDEPGLSGAFYRLMRWHSAYFTILVQREIDQERLDNWCEIINANVLVKHDKMQFGPTLWRGSVHLQTSDASEDISSQGFEFRLDLVENSEKFFNFQSNKCAQQENLEHVILSSKLQFVDECRFASIPSYMVSPMIFRLHFSKPNLHNRKTSRFVEYLLNKQETALILKLGYAERSEKKYSTVAEGKKSIKSDKTYCTSRWRKSVLSGCIKDADCFVSTFDEHILFAVTKSKHSGQIIAFPLRDPGSLDASFYFSSVNHKISSPVNPTPGDEKTRKVYHNILSQLPFIKTPLFYKFMKEVMRLKIHPHKNGDFDDTKISTDISALWEKLKNTSPCPLSKEATTSNIQFEQIDSSDWPERIYLLRKQIQNEIKMKSLKPNALLELGPKLPLQIVSFSSEDIKQYFLPTGELKNIINAESINSFNLSQHITADLDTVLHSKWPEIVSSVYHDLYYNTSCEAEEKESVGNQMINSYVRHETASTCNKHQITQNFSVIIPGKSSPAKEFRSPSYRRATSVIAKKIRERENADCKENIKDLLSKRILSTSRAVPSRNTVKREFADQNGIVSKNSNRANMKRKNELPVRCSPRKKKLVDYTYSSVNRKPETVKKDKSSKSTDLSDLLRKKLRCAVAVALESEGIELNDAFYQPCGKKLFTICKAFVQDISQKKGKMSEHLQRIADAHVKQVVEFEKQNQN